ncbi:MAG: SpoIIIAC/SpoIIIAD family protein [Christensenellales bacterium]
METAGKLAGFAVCAALVALILRHLRPEAGWGVSLGAGAIVLLAALPALSALVRGIASLSAMSGLDEIQQLLKIAGLSLLLDFAAQTCRDAQEEALALKVEFAGRVLLLSSALPVLQALLSQLVSLPLS